MRRIFIITFVLIILYLVIRNSEIYAYITNAGAKVISSTVKTVSGG